jgi:cytoskeletal protein CcmA (bactofilin family)
MPPRTQRPEPDALECILGPRATFSGTLRSETSIRIDGAVEGGLIETPANVILTEGARVHCDITAKTVSIRGVFQGTLRADRVELLSGSRVAGSIQVNSFYMDDGVFMQAEVTLRGARPGQPAGRFGPAAPPIQPGSPAPVNGQAQRTRI